MVSPARVRLEVGLFLVLLFIGAILAANDYFRELEFPPYVGAAAREVCDAGAAVMNDRCTEVVVVDGLEVFTVVVQLERGGTQHYTLIFREGKLIDVQ